jgi:hypothetical protein
MKEKIDKSTLIEIEIASPLHVGAAAEQHWQEGIDYFVNKGKTYVISLDSLSKEIDPQELSSLLLNKSTGAIINQVKSKIDSIAYKTFETVASKEIKRLIFSALGGKPYLPGSSLKGAIRSILFSHFLKAAKPNISSYSPKDLQKYLESDMLGGFENSVMRFLQFGDVPFQDSLVVNSKIFNLQQNQTGGWKNGKSTDQRLIKNSFNTFYECLNVGSTGFTSFSYRSTQATNLINAANTSNKVKSPPNHTLSFLNNFSFDNLFEIINRHTISYLEKEIAFFDKYQFDDASRVMLASLTYLKEKAERLDDTQACMLRMAAGSGFHSITGDWKYDIYDDKIGIWNSDDVKNRLCKNKDVGKQRYKSRKVAIYSEGNIQRAEPLGFIILRKTSEKQLLANEEAILAKQAEAKKPQMLDAMPTNGLKVDAIVVQMDKPTKVHIFLKGYDKRFITMSECAAMPIGYVCRVKLVVKKKNIERVIHIAPK